MAILKQVGNRLVREYDLEKLENFLSTIERNHPITK